jgi:hypothetical protein
VDVAGRSRPARHRAARLEERRQARLLVPCSRHEAVGRVGRVGRRQERRRAEEAPRNRGLRISPSLRLGSAERIKDMEIDGVEAEVSTARSACGCSRCATECCSTRSSRPTTTGSPSIAPYDPKRLHGLGCVSLWDVEQGVKELRRLRRVGFQGRDDLGLPAARTPIPLEGIRPALGRRARPPVAAVAAHRDRYG